MSNPLVSICLPCFNAERYIGAAIESVLAQTYAPIEVIVVDDGSSDGSADVVGSYQANGVRLVSGYHMGAAAARNLAFAQSSGRFVLFLDADDLIGPDHVKSLAARLEETDRRLAFGRLARFSGNPGSAARPWRNVGCFLSQVPSSKSMVAGMNGSACLTISSFFRGSFVKVMAWPMPRKHACTIAWASPGAFRD